MPEQPCLVFTGNVIVDIVMTIGALPEPGGDTIASSSALMAGGGYNVMVAAQRDGLPVVFAGQYGTGPFGDVVRTALESSGFAVVQRGLTDADSGYCIALVDASTERTFVTHVGAEGRLTSTDLDLVEVGAADLVYVSGYSLAHPVNAGSLPGWLEALPGDVRVITDPSPLVGWLDPAVLTVNAREARIATGRDDLRSAATELLGRIRAGGSALVRDGANGCWVASADIAGSPVLVPGFAVDAVDTNGAGDAHGGVLSAALARGEGMIDAVRRANAAAAIAVTRSGPATAPTGDEIDALLSLY
jgi:sugar/nucleoside kinase (ribokinase family)